METSISSLPDASGSKPDERIETPVSDLPDLYACIQTAAIQLPVRHGEVVLKAIELQKMVNASRAQDEAQDQVQDREDQEYELKGQDNDHEGLDDHEGLHEREGQPDKHEGQGRDQDGFLMRPSSTSTKLKEVSPETTRTAIWMMSSTSSETDRHVQTACALC